MRRIPEGWLADFPTEPWDQIKAIGNRLRHEYFRIDDAILWEIITTDAHVLKSVMEAMEQIAGALATHYHYHDDDELTTRSNAAVDLVNAGKLDEAERVAHDLLQRFPDVHDGWDRLGMVYEARGENQ